MKTTETAPATKKTSTKKAAPASKKAAPKASKSLEALTAVVEQFRKETGKTVALMITKVINRTNCWSFQYDNHQFVIFAKPDAVESGARKVVQAHNTAK